MRSSSRYFSAREAAEALGVTHPSVVGWAKAGKMAFAICTPGGWFKFSVANILAMTNTEEARHDTYEKLKAMLECK